MLQMAESTMPAQLGLLNGQLKEIFGEKYNSLFMTIKPKDLLFNGIPICAEPKGLAKMICSVIKNQKPQSMREMDDGSLMFSFFSHVSWKDNWFQIFFFSQFDSKNNDEISLFE